MTAFISEFRSMTFQCKSSVSSSIQFSEINSYIERDHIMAPQQRETLPKSSDQILDSERSREHRVSPTSSLGTSMESSSPTLPSETSSQNINQNYEMRQSLIDPSSDDSGSMANDMPGYHTDQENPLEQLKCSLAKDGMLGQKLQLSEYAAQKEDIPSSNGVSLSSSEQSCTYHDNHEIFNCHLCTYSCTSKQDFNGHMNTHFDHKCPYCDYTSRTEGRLKRHVKDFHSETPPESWAGSRVPRTNGNNGELVVDDSVSSSNGKSRSYRCKQCDFIAYQKNDFWEHNKIHIKAEKLLSCHKCAFVTEYKHHLEYHIRNHFGSKPYKCSKCNYSCVNKSMLNSHMKSHSNIYQYRCANCTYATKYCHSLKLHLRKYDHRPATVLNLDGTPNPYPVIDVYGTRRGPRTKKRRIVDDSECNPVSTTAVTTSQQSLNYPPTVPLLPPNVSPLMYPPQFFNGYPSSAYMKAPQPIESSFAVAMPNFRMKHNDSYKCLFCDFSTDQHDAYEKHRLFHIAAENPDLAKLYGVSSDSLHFQDRQLINYLQNRRHIEHTLRENRNGFPCESTEERSTFIENGIKCEEENSVDQHMDNMSPTCNEIESRRDSSSPSQPCTASSPIQPSQPENDENERSVIVANTSSSLSSNIEQHEGTLGNDNTAEHSPLDLSGCKQHESSNSGKNKIAETSFDKKVIECNLSASRTESSTSSIHRNRRKGRAFKIDHYIQYDDQPMQLDVKSSIQSNYEHCENGMINSDEENSVVFQQNTKQLSQLPNDQLNKFSTSEKQQKISQVNNLNKNNPRSPHNSLISPQNSPRSPQSHPNSPPIHTNQQDSSHSSTFNENCSAPVLNTNAKELNSFSKTSIAPKMEVEEPTNSSNPKKPETFECEYCAIAFKDCVMYTVHMGYHGFTNPFTCNMCGHESDNRVDFFIHIARAAHV